MTDALAGSRTATPGFRGLRDGAEDMLEFRTRVTGGVQQWAVDKQVDAFKRYKKAVAAVGSETGSGIALRSILFYVCISGEHASDWARRNGKTPQVGIELLRMALIDLCHHYGLAKKQSHPTKAD